MAESGQSEVARTVGVVGATAIIVGFVIGVSVFVLPGSLAGSTGPGVVVSYAAASLLGLLAGVVGAQLGCAYQTDAASFVAVSQLLGVRWGFLLVWMIVGASAIGVGLLALGLANYLGNVLTVEVRGVAVGAVLVSGAVNLCGARAGAGLQLVLVVAFLAALFLFVGAGLPAVDGDLLSPFLPRGAGPVFAAIVPAYFSYAGFFVIIELAGEIESPAQTIPRAMAISFVLVVVTYLAVALTLVGLVPWEALGGDPAPVVTAARRVLPEALMLPLALTAVAAGASSINGILLAYSRDLHALAERGLLPRKLLLHARSLPDRTAGVVPMTLLALVAVMSSGDITALATQAVLGILFAQVLLGLALWQLPRRDPHRLATAGFVLPSVALRASAGLLVVASAAIALLVVAGSPRQAALAGAFLGLGGLVHALSVRRGSPQQSL
ncbi:APC family permease [Pseudohaliea sp.]|uniref:APC family permease n=1 Tax=Pseudohaliea sp. TaxID=2740289 RepID=UPI0032EF4B81